MRSERFVQRPFSISQLHFAGTIMRLLIVEDEERLARRLADSFESSGYAVDLAFDGESAEILLHAEEYDAAILDRSEEHTSELQSQSNLVCRLLLETKK